MDFFSKLFGNKKEIAPFEEYIIIPANFAKYGHIVHLNSNELSFVQKMVYQYNFHIHSILKAYGNESGWGMNDSKCEIASFLWSITVIEFKKIQLTQKVGAAVYESIHESFQSLEHKIKSIGFSSFSDYILSRQELYQKIMRFTTSEQENFLSGLTNIYNLFFDIPLTVVPSNDFLRLPTILVDISKMTRFGQTFGAGYEKFVSNVSAICNSYSNSISHNSG